MREVEEDLAAQSFVGSCATLLHAQALAVCAEGVDDARDAQVLWACGIDAVTGPWASAQRPSA